MAKHRSPQRWPSPRRLVGLLDVISLPGGSSAKAGPALFCPPNDSRDMTKQFQGLRVWGNFSLAILLGFGIGARDVAAEELPSSRWPGFLGANATVVNSIPETWSHESNVAWTASLPGHGQSSPVIWGQQVFVTAIEGPEKDTNHILKISLDDGEIEWDKTFPTSLPVENSVYVSRAAPTPVVDEHGIYAFFESGDVIALTHDGQLRWSRSLSKDYGKFKNRFGLSASPVQTTDQLIVLVDDQGPSYLVGMSKETGETIWKSDRESRMSWSSPALMEIDGVEQVVVSSAGSVDGYNPKNGERLWTFDDVGGNTAATPMPLGDGAFLIGASPGRNGENAEGAMKSNMALKVVKGANGYEPKVLGEPRGRPCRSHHRLPTAVSPIG